MTKFILKLTLLAALFANVLTVGGPRGKSAPSVTAELSTWNPKDNKSAKDCANSNVTIVMLKKMFSISSDFINQDVQVAECKQSESGSNTYLKLQKNGNTCELSYKLSSNAGSTKDFIKKLRDCAQELEKENVPETIVKPLETVEEENQFVNEESVAGQETKNTEDVESPLVEEEEEQNHHNNGYVRLDDGDNEFAKVEEAEQRDVDEEDRSNRATIEEVPEEEEESIFGAEEFKDNQVEDTAVVVKQCEPTQRASVIMQLRSLDSKGAYKLKDCQAKDGNNVVIEVEYKNEVCVVEGPAKLEEGITRSKSLRVPAVTVLKTNVTNCFKKISGDKAEATKLAQKLKEQEKKNKTQAESQENLQTLDKTVEESITANNIDNPNTVDAEERNETAVDQVQEDDEEVTVFDTTEIADNKEEEVAAVVQQCDGTQRVNVIMQLRSLDAKGAYKLKDCQVKQGDDVVVEVEYKNEVCIVEGQAKLEEGITRSKSLRVPAVTVLKTNVTACFEKLFNDKAEATKLAQKLKKQDKKKRQQANAQARAQEKADIKEESVEETIAADNTDNQTTDISEDNNDIVNEDAVEVNAQAQIAETKEDVEVDTRKQCSKAFEIIFKIQFGMINKAKHTYTIDNCFVNESDDKKAVAEISIGTTQCTIPFSTKTREGPTRKISGSISVDDIFTEAAKKCLGRAIMDHSIPAPKKTKKRNNKPKKVQENSTVVASTANEDNNRISVKESALGGYEASDDFKIATELFAKLIVADIMTGRVVYTQNVVSVSTQNVNGINYSAIYKFNGKKCQLKAYSDFNQKTFKMYHDKVNEDNQYFLKNSEFTPFTEENCFDVYGSELARSRL